jgi:hypothetical protein
MRYWKKFLSVMLAVLLITVALPGDTGVKADDVTNYIVNGDFETDANSDWKADNWTASAAVNPYAWIDTSGTKVLRIKAAGIAASGTVSQIVQGDSGGRLPDGIYTLEAKVQGDPNEVSSLKLFAKDTGSADVESANVISTSMAAAFYQVKLENIKVTAGSCSAGLAVQLNGALAAWTWTLDMDNVSFYKTGEINYTVNGDFETDATADWKADNWTASEDINPYAWIDTSGTKVLRLKAAGSAKSGTVSQTVQGLSGGELPDGKYTLQARAQGDPGEVGSLRLYAKNTGVADVTSSNLVSTTMSAAFYQIRLENIEVAAGSCTVGMAVDFNGLLAAWSWTLDIDDVLFYKTGELSGSVPTVVSVATPAVIPTIVNQAPILPAKVTASLSNGNTSDVTVIWTSPAAILYTGAETIGTTFTVQGTAWDNVAGTDFPVVATVNVTCKSFDLNADSTVNVGDLAIASYNFGSKTQDSDWNSVMASDVDGSGVIDNADLVLISDGILGD